jgi:hypothetical protein
MYFAGPTDITHHTRANIQIQKICERESLGMTLSD